jgi:hypothetical protein
MNVLEHVKHDTLALCRMKELLNRDGTLILLVPAHRFLYNSIDIGVGHYRRYTRQERISKLSPASAFVEFSIITSLEFLGGT